MTSIILAYLQNNVPAYKQFMDMLQNPTGKTRVALILSFLVCFALFGGKIVQRNGKIVLFLPGFIYDLVGNSTYLGNRILLDFRASRQKEKSVWNDGDGSVSVEALKAKISDARVADVSKQILNQAEVSYVQEELVRLYDSLPAVNTEELLVGRTFNGKILRTGSSILDSADRFLIQPLSYFGIKWGKRYITQHTGDPLLFNFAKKIYFPIPMWGNVGVADIKWRGVATGTMNYDTRQWKDYFRVLEHDPATKRLVLLGVWTSGAYAGGWFTLTWDPEVPVE